MNQSGQIYGTDGRHFEKGKQKRTQSFVGLGMRNVDTEFHHAWATYTSVTDEDTNIPHNVHRQKSRTAFCVSNKHSISK